MKVLLIGGTGAMGKHLSKILSDNCIETFVTTRKHRIDSKYIKYMVGNALEMEFLKKTMNTKWDAIVDFMLYSSSQFYERIELLLNSTTHYFYISSSRVYANSKSKIIESSPRLLDHAQDEEFLNSGEYSLQKAEQENYFLNATRNNWTIIRPYITYSEERLQLGVFEKEEWLYRALQGKTIVFSKEIARKKTTLTYGLDVANAIYSLFRHPETKGQVYHITQNNSNSWNEILAIYLKIIEEYTGKRPRVLDIGLNELKKLKPSPYSITKDRLYNREFNTSKINEYIPIDNFTEAYEGIKICLNEILINKKFHKINWTAEAKKDKLTKEISKINEIPGLKTKLRYLYYRFLG